MSSVTKPSSQSILMQDITSVEQDHEELPPPKETSFTFMQTHCYSFPKKFREGEVLCHHPGKLYLGQNTEDAARFINVVTTPKSGTHLLMKVLRLLGINHKYKSLNMAYAPHLCQYADLVPYRFLDTEYLKSTFDIKEKYIVTIRDPKDFLISLIQWYDKEMDQHMIPYEQEWKDATMAEKLDRLLAGGDQMKFKTLQSAPWYISNYLVAARLMDLGPTHILFLKFEDLIGPEMGGSSKKEQIEAYRKLCRFTDAKFIRPKINRLIKLLPGKTLTYIPQKKVGRWEQYFTDENKRQYNIRFQVIERILGYPFKTAVKDKPQPIDEVVGQ